MIVPVTDQLVAVSVKATAPTKVASAHHMKTEPTSQPQAASYFAISRWRSAAAGQVAESAASAWSGSTGAVLIQRMRSRGLGQIRRGRERDGTPIFRYSVRSPVRVGQGSGAGVTLPGRWKLEEALPADLGYLGFDGSSAPSACPCVSRFGLLHARHGGLCLLALLGVGRTGFGLLPQIRQPESLQFPPDLGHDGFIATALCAGSTLIVWDDASTCAAAVRDSLRPDVAYVLARRSCLLRRTCRSQSHARRWCPTAVKPDAATASLGAHSPEDLTLINRLVRDLEGVEDGLLGGRDLRGEGLGGGVDRDGR